MLPGKQQPKGAECHASFIMHLAVSEVDTQAHEKTAEAQRRTAAKGYESIPLPYLTVPPTCYWARAVGCQSAPLSLTPTCYWARGPP